jgi:hypothetical protein
MTEQSDDQRKLENLRNRMNKLSGYPVWSSGSLFSSNYSPGPSLSIEIPRGTVSVASYDLFARQGDGRYPYYNYTNKFREFIHKHRLDKVANYVIFDHPNDDTCEFSLRTDSIKELSAVVDCLEDKLQPEFQELMRGMLKAALPDWVFSESTLSDVGINFNEITTAGEIIKKLCLVAADQADPSKAEQAKQILQEIAERTPALEPVINAEQPEKHAQPISAEAEKIRPQSKERE